MLLDSGAIKLFNHVTLRIEPDRLLSTKLTFRMSHLKMDRVLDFVKRIVV